MDRCWIDRAGCTGETNGIATDERLSLTVGACGIGAFEELDGGSRPGFTGNRDIGPGDHHAIDYWEIHQIIRASVAVARVVASHTVAGEVDAELAVRGNRVAQYRHTG